MSKTEGFVFGFVKESNCLEITIIVESDEKTIKFLQELDVHNAIPTQDLEVNAFFCTICQRDYQLCNHLIGNQYDGNVCMVIPDCLQYAKISLSEPIQPTLTITDMLLIEDDKDDRKFFWFGFKSDNDRRKRLIHGIVEPNMIPRSVMEYFIEYFSSHSTGIAFFKQKNSK